MNPSEAAKLLGKIAIFDRRITGESDAYAWAEAMDARVTLVDALEAVSAHRSESGEWLMPHHINNQVRRLQKERLRVAGPAPIPDGLDYQQERAWLRLWIDAVKVRDVDPEATANAAMGIAVTAIAPRPLSAVIESQAQRWTA